MILYIPGFAFLGIFVILGLSFSGPFGGYFIFLRLLKQIQVYICLFLALLKVCVFVGELLFFWLYSKCFWYFF